MTPRDLAILVPVLRRPQNVAPLVTSIRANTPAGHSIVFVADPDDTHEHEAIRANGCELLIHGGGYAHKINTAVRVTSESLLFLAADDLHFHPGWLEAAVRRIDQGAQVVGVNDMLERRRGRRGHATHFLMTREYATSPTIDGGRGPLHEGYDHSFVDDELIATANHRGVYVYAPDSRVEHRHWMNGIAHDDDTYRKGRRLFRVDRRTYLKRTRLWT